MRISFSGWNDVPNYPEKCNHCGAPKPYIYPHEVMASVTHRKRVPDPEGAIEFDMGQL